MDCLIAEKRKEEKEEKSGEIEKKVDLTCHAMHGIMVSKQPCRGGWSSDRDVGESPARIPTAMQRLMLTANYVGILHGRHS